MRSNHEHDPFGTKGDANVTAIADACRALTQGATDDAPAIITSRYPFEAIAKAGRRYSEVEMMGVFTRDCFIDRYSGAKLVFPGVLRLLSVIMPAEFPFHPNWKTVACHPAYWDLFPTIDHVVPVARGGADDESNWATASMLSNAAKANWTIEELGWRLHPAGLMDDWDGLVGWFLDYCTAHPEVVAKSPYLRRWWRAVQQVRKPG